MSNPKTQILTYAYEWKGEPSHRFPPCQLFGKEMPSETPSLETSRKHSAAGRRSFPFFFQLLTLVLIRNVDVPRVVFDHEAIPPEVIRWTSRLSASSPGTKVSEVTLKTVTLERFPLEDQAILRSVCQKTNQKKVIWRSMLRNFIEQRGLWVASL